MEGTLCALKRPGQDDFFLVVPQRQREILPEHVVKQATPTYGSARVDLIGVECLYIHIDHIIVRVTKLYLAFKGRKKNVERERQKRGLVKIHHHHNE